MSKKIFAALIVAVVATFAGYNIYQSQKTEKIVSDLVIANVEALAGDTEGGATTVSYTHLRHTQNYFLCR